MQAYACTLSLLHVAWLFMQLIPVTLYLNIPVTDTPVIDSCYLHDTHTLLEKVKGTYQTMFTLL